MLPEVLAGDDIPPSDPRWKIRESLARFIEEHFESHFFLVEDLKLGYFSFVVRSNPQLDMFVNKLNKDELGQKLTGFLKNEKIPPAKVRLQFLKSDDPQAPADDKIIRLDIL